MQCCIVLRAQPQYSDTVLCSAHAVSSVPPQKN